MSAAAVCALLASSTFWSSADSASSFWTTLNWAVSERNWVASEGLDGSWYFSWATRSLRKVLESSWVDPVALVDAEGGVGVVPVVPVLDEVPLTVVMVVPPSDRRVSDADVEPARGEGVAVAGPGRGAPERAGGVRACGPLLRSLLLLPARSPFAAGRAVGPRVRPVRRALAALSVRVGAGAGRQRGGRRGGRRRSDGVRPQRDVA